MVITYFESLAQKILNGELSGYFLTRNRKIKVESWYLRQNKTGGTIDEQYPYIIVGGDLKGTTFTSEGKYRFDYHTSDHAVSDFDLIEFFQYEKTNKQKNMKNERTVKLTLEKAQEWYEQGGELRKVALQAFTEEELKPSKPVTWKQYCDNYRGTIYWTDNESNICYSDIDITSEGLSDKSAKNTFPTQELAEAFLAYMQVMSLRKAWIGGWKPIWGTTFNDKYCIVRYGDILTVEDYRSSTFPRALSFPTEAMAQDFLRNFRTELEKAKELF